MSLEVGNFCYFGLKLACLGRLPTRPRKTEKLMPAFWGLQIPEFFKHGLPQRSKGLYGGSLCDKSELAEGDYLIKSDIQGTRIIFYILEQICLINDIPGRVYGIWYQ